MRGACRISWPPYLATPGGNHDGRGEHTGGARVIGVVLALGLPGCVVGPDFKPPAAPSTTHHTSPDEVSALFEDPTIAKLARHLQSKL